MAPKGGAGASGVFSWLACICVLALGFALICSLLPANRHTQKYLRLYLAPDTDPDPAARGKRRHETETCMRERLGKIFGVEFKKVRPTWLRNPTTNRCLELDMYSEELALAFEYDGAQHTHFTPHYHGSREHYEYRVLVDQLKSRLCVEHDVTLIRIPYTIRPGNLISFLEGRAAADPDSRLATLLHSRLRL